MDWWTVVRYKPERCVEKVNKNKGGDAEFISIFVSRTTYHVETFHSLRLDIIKTEETINEVKKKSISTVSRKKVLLILDRCACKHKIQN